MQGNVILDGTRTIGTALLGSVAASCLLLGVMARLPAATPMRGGRLPMRRRTLASARQLMLALLIPAAALTIWPELLLIPFFHRLPPSLQQPLAWLHETGAGVPLRLVIGTLPAMLLPLLGGLSRMPAGQARAGAGLGARLPTMLRLVWLPQLGPTLALGLLLAAAIDAAALLVHHR
ncbi:hypothetical protein [Lichenicola sp.]|uniref:hypothetical protein n=1 Tax=Lichenicola sp. TaxID=2804529 RepID=UPI003B00B832